VGQRAVAVLRLLVAAAGAPISKDKLIETAWPGLTVEESNLTVKIAACGVCSKKNPVAKAGSRRCPAGYRYVGPAVTAQDNAGDKTKIPKRCDILPLAQWWESFERSAIVALRNRVP
jgi:hypothetical protein